MNENEWKNIEDIEYIKYLQNDRYLRVIIPCIDTGVDTITAEVRVIGRDYHNYEDGFSSVEEAKKYAEKELAGRLL